MNPLLVIGAIFLVLNILKSQNKPVLPGKKFDKQGLPIKNVTS